MYIEEAYGDGKFVKGINERDVEDDDDEFDDDPCFYVSEKAHDAFEADIERWLNEVNSVCPIEFAYRPEDGEAGGTELSDWHLESLKSLPSLIEKWDKERCKMDENEKDWFKNAIAGILEYGEVKYETLADAFIEEFFPEQKLKRLFEKKDMPMRI
jgi:hypothetical protein